MNRSLEYCLKLTITGMQRVHFLPGDLTSEVKLLERNGEILAEASAGDVVAFSVADPLPKV
jgi:translation elongation factor EF-1alpha